MGHKEEVQKLLDQLPDDSSFVDIQYHIFVREKIECGLKDIEAGDTLNQKEVEKKDVQMARKIDVL